MLREHVGASKGRGAFEAFRVLAGRHTWVLHSEKSAKRLPVISEGCKPAAAQLRILPPQPDFRKSLELLENRLSWGEFHVRVTHGWYTTEIFVPAIPHVVRRGAFY